MVTTAYQVLVDWNNNGDFVDASGQITHLTFSTVNDNTVGWANGTESQFNSRLMTDGQLFRFANDPNPNIYKIKQATLIAAEAYPIDLTDAGFGDQENDGWYTGGLDVNFYPNFSQFNFANLTNNNYTTNDIGDNLSKRTTIIIRICRLDLETEGENPEEGIDLNAWDPRGQVQHNGIGSFKIEFIKKGTDVDLQDDDVVTNNACWETEPK